VLLRFELRKSSQNVFSVNFLFGKRRRDYLRIFEIINFRAFAVVIIFLDRSQWLRALRHKTVVSRLLGLRVRIPRVAWISVVSVLCFQVEVPTAGLSLVQRNLTKCVCVCVSLSVIMCNSDLYICHGYVEEVRLREKERTREYFLFITSYNYVNSY
jgi:hypothetical protein